MEEAAGVGWRLEDMKALVILAIRVYRAVFSPLKSVPSCRFYPTCSEYAIQAVEAYGVGRGLWLAFKRIFRCRPWGPSGYDPIP